MYLLVVCSVSIMYCTKMTVIHKVDSVFQYIFGTVDSDNLSSLLTLPWLLRFVQI